LPSEITLFTLLYMGMIFLRVVIISGQYVLPRPTITTSERTQNIIFEAQCPVEKATNQLKLL
jgi:hypothetical protein